MCESCGTIYAVGDESADTGVCVKCGGTVVQRADDTEEAVRKRLSTYQEQTEPLLDWFRERGKLLEVDGVGEPDVIAAALIDAISSASDTGD